MFLHFQSASSNFDSEVIGSKSKCDWKSFLDQNRMRTVHQRKRTPISRVVELVGIRRLGTMYSVQSKLP